MMGVKERNFSPLPWRASARSHATRAKRERRGRSSHPLLDPVRSYLPSQHHSTGSPSAERYGARYEGEASVRTSQNAPSMHSAE